MIQKDEGGSYEFVSENGYHYELVGDSLFAMMICGSRTRCLLRSRGR